MTFNFIFLHLFLFNFAGFPGVLFPVEVEYVGANYGKWNRKDAARRRQALELGEKLAPPDSDTFKLKAPDLVPFTK